MIVEMASSGDGAHKGRENERVPPPVGKGKRDKSTIRDTLVDMTTRLLNVELVIGENNVKLDEFGLKVGGLVEELYNE